MLDNEEQEGITIPAGISFTIDDLTRAIEALAKTAKEIAEMGERPVKPKPPFARVGHMRKGYRHWQPPTEYKLMTTKQEYLRPKLLLPKGKR